MTASDDVSEPTLREKLHGIRLVAGFRPLFAAGIVALNLLTAIFEGIGLGLLVPIIETAQAGENITAQASGVTSYFLVVYSLVGVPFTLETLLLGLAAVMAVRYALSFCTSWLGVILRTQYLAHLRTQCFDRLLSAEVSYLDDQDGDVMTNTIVTEAAQASGLISRLLNVVQTCFFALIYVTVALLIAPFATAVAVGVLGTVVVFTRYVVRPSYGIGDQVSEANERIQGLVNAAIRGIHDIKLFNVGDRLNGEYRDAHGTLVETRVALTRNRAALNNLNQFLNVLALFVLVYIAVAYLSLSFASLGVLLFAMFRLSPQISSLNDSLYTIDGALPHIVRTQSLLERLADNAETDGGDPVPTPVTSISASGVTFRYDDGDGTDIRDVDIEAERGETVALVGPSGAGKSTIVSLLARLYTPDSGTIRADGHDIGRFDVDSWQERVAVVPQHPFVFNETLRDNVAVGSPDATDEEIERACRISQVSAFLDELPDGLDSDLGDDAVRLSGGQRQRVAIARALVSDADVLLLDEATSELDSPTEAAIVDGIESMDTEFVTVVVGHWLSTVRDADRIYTIEGGVVVESGTHDELIAGDGEYASLYAPQIESRPHNR
ncbi:ATP-binding cassette domain-containing protein [Halapricum sp. CBA1109]|uniref:ABC transporter ATP-binding protein n=1 Tax=Halapricum sp. CBA1109 TaxID=2668068 RepID=UPI0012FC6DCA|nr:ABC transporter ATP-binding protein [Halapricum sp. CBA1109]MUV88611.1 ATP-binding cassette domain-containing protein [Halapricum sp. CBA1109]